MGTLFFGRTCLWVDRICLDRFCSGTLFVWGHCNVCLGDFIHLGNSFVQEPWCFRDIGSFVDLTHPGTSFVPSLCLPGALICPCPRLFWDLFCLGTLFFSLPFLMGDSVSLETFFVDLVHWVHYFLNDLII